MAGGSKGYIYDVRGEGTTKSTAIPGIHLNAELYLSMLASFVYFNKSCVPDSYINPIFTFDASIFIEWENNLYAEEKD